MHTVTIAIQCYNEVTNVRPLSNAIIEQFEQFLPHYNYYIQFSDNCSTDGTRDVLEEMCKNNERIRAIFNVKNFGAVGRSGVNNLLAAEGDCVISMCSDFQDPPALIPEIIKTWENGAKIVCCIKNKSKENKLMYLIRTFYYNLIQKFSEIDQIKHFTGFGLYDREFIEIFRNLHDPHPVMRGIVAEFGYGVEKIAYEQPKRKSGKSKHNFFSLFDVAMWNFTTYTKSLRIATLGGLFSSGVCLLMAFVYFILKMTYWRRFQAGIAPLVIGMFLIASLQIFFIGLVGEYIMSMNSRIINRPYVIEEKRINFKEKNEVILQNDILRSEEI